MLFARASLAIFTRAVQLSTDHCWPYVPTYVGHVLGISACVGPYCRQATQARASTYDRIGAGLLRRPVTGRSLTDSVHRQVSEV